MHLQAAERKSLNSTQKKESGSLVAVSLLWPCFVDINRTLLEILSTLVKQTVYSLCHLPGRRTFFWSVWFSINLCGRLVVIRAKEVMSSCSWWLSHLFHTSDLGRRWSDPSMTLRTSNWFCRRCPSPRPSQRTTTTADLSIAAAMSDSVSKKKCWPLSCKKKEGEDVCVVRVRPLTLGLPFVCHYHPRSRPHTPRRHTHDEQSCSASVSISAVWNNEKRKVCKRVRDILCNLALTPPQQRGQPDTGHPEVSRLTTPPALVLWSTGFPLDPLHLALPWNPTLFHIQTHPGSVNKGGPTSTWYQLRLFGLWATLFFKGIKNGLYFKSSVLNLHLWFFLLSKLYITRMIYY